VPSLLAGYLPEQQHLLSEQPKQMVALQKFSYLMMDIQAAPKAHVAYFREAWVSTQDNSIRVTMDRDVRCAVERAADLGLEPRNPVMPFVGHVILELKFTGRYPNWFRDLVQTFGLVRGAAAKYADGVSLLGEERFYRRGPVNGKAVRRSGQLEYAMDNAGQCDVKT
jgi:hypothetical protein